MLSPRDLMNPTTPINITWYHPFYVHISPVSCWEEVVLYKDWVYSASVSFVSVSSIAILGIIRCLSKSRQLMIPLNAKVSAANHWALVCDIVICQISESLSRESSSQVSRQISWSSRNSLSVISCHICATLPPTSYPPPLYCTCLLSKPLCLFALCHPSSPLLRAHH